MAAEGTEGIKANTKFQAMVERVLGRPVKLRNRGRLRNPHSHLGGA
jgi:hypothetical protein